MLSRFSSVVFRFLITLICLSAVVASVLLAQAERLRHDGRLESLIAADRLIPINSVYKMQLASLEPAAQGNLLKQAIALNEYNSKAWIQLGLTSEFQERDERTAESCYLRAVDVDKSFVAKENLLQYYFRSNQQAKFLALIGPVLHVSYSDPRFLFQQLWSVSSDQQANSQLIPDRLQVLLPYVDFLSSTQRFDAVGPSLHRALTALLKSGVDPDASPSSLFPTNSGQSSFRAFFGVVLDQLLASNQVGLARTFWEELHARNWVKGTLPTTDNPVVNGEFRQASFKHGFDWLFPTNPGVIVEQASQAAGLTINLNGEQPDQCVLAQQYVLLEPGVSYRLNWRAEGESVGSDKGFTWTLVPVLDQFAKTIVGSPVAAHHPSNGSDNGSVSPDLLPRESQAQAWRFISSTQPLNLLRLEYHRRSGTVRPEGEIFLTRVSLKRS